MVRSATYGHPVRVVREYAPGTLRGTYGEPVRAVRLVRPGARGERGQRITPVTYVPDGVTGLRDAQGSVIEAVSFYSQEGRTADGRVIRPVAYYSSTGLPLIEALFAGGTAGAAYLISPETCFTDTARTTPAQVDQAVAAVTDLVPRPELVTNGGFDSAAGWTLNTAANISGGTLNVTGAIAGGVNVASQGAPTVGTTYVVSFTIVSITGEVSSALGGALGATRSTPGTYTDTLTATNINAYQIISRGAGVSAAVIDNISVRQVGNHLTQATAASRPILRRGVFNKCTNYNANPTDLTNVAFTNATNGLATLTVVTDAAELAAAGLSGVCTSGTVYKLDNTLGNSAVLAAPAGAVGNLNTHTASIYARKVGTAMARLMISNESGTGVPAQILAGGYVRHSLSFTPSATWNQITIRCEVGAVAYFILNQLEAGPNASDIIAVVSGAASSASYGPYYLEFDGVDDFLRAAFAIAQPFDRISAIRQVSFTNNDQLFGGVTANRGALFQNLSSPALALFSGTTACTNSDALIGANAVVIERHGGASSRLGVNGGAYATGDAGTGLPGGITLAADSAGANAANIRLYSLLMRSPALSDAETVLARRMAAATCGKVL